MTCFNLVDEKYLMSRICEWLAHGKLVKFILLVKTKRKTEYIGSFMSRRSVVEYMTRGHPLPSGSIEV